MKLSFFIVIIIFYNSLLYASIYRPDSTLLYSYIENNVAKNIFIYRLKTSPIVENDLSDKYLKPYNSFLNVLPDFGYKLDLQIKQSKLLYPDTSFILYSIYKKYDRYFNDSIIIDKDFPYFNNDCYFLVAINSNNDLKFISGNFFLNSIYKDFKLDVNVPESYYNYIKLKTFNLQTDKILFVKTNKKQLIFVAYSYELKDSITIFIELDKPENVLINYNSKK
ncbi:MAG: hypothetical protein A2046_07875 [Bacteroidetes bacterium GWA2_30_7]|nr:MAG: hypothetical protein A2046_07875 [Bacteroidetes bacterium GWA2_30_7]